MENNSRLTKSCSEVESVLAPKLTNYQKHKKYYTNYNKYSII